MATQTTTAARSRLAAIVDLVSRLDAADNEQAEILIEEITREGKAWVRGPWVSPMEADPAPAEYRIDLEPGLRLAGELLRGVPQSARLEYQSAQGWTALYPVFAAEVKAMMRYARTYYFGQ